MKGFVRKVFLSVIIYLLLVLMVPAAVVYFLSEKPGGIPGMSTESLSVKSYVSATDSVQELPLEEYLVGVVGAEMPAVFPEEALKAQAVAARTFIISKMNNVTEDAHGGTGAPVCTDPGHCKAWKSREELLAAWGGETTASGEYMEKIEKAVGATAGEIITYEGKPISAVYYSMSGGKTENSADVWGGNVPYLKSVNSSFDENAPGFNSEAAFTLEEFKRVITAEDPQAVFGDDPSLWVTDVITSEGGGVISMKIGGREFKGTRLRTLFSLRSHNFTLTFREGLAIFTVKGYGHGVGMSQWGSRFLAEEGKSYAEILKYYYTGVDITKMQKN